MEQQNARNKPFLKYKLESVNSKSTLLTRSLLWMSFGLIFIILVAWLSATITPFYEFVLRFSLGSTWIWSWVINLVIVFALFFTIKNKNLPIVIPAVIYAAFAFYEGIFITTILAFSGTTNMIKDLLLYMLIPAGIFAIMGVLGYFNVINFTKLLPFAIFGILALFILSMVLLFTSNWVVETTYLFLAAVIFIIWVGIDLQILLRAQDAIDYATVDKRMVNRLAFIFGINLFIDFVNLLYIIIRILR